jgi:HAD superfamily hydrolase (TIGR01509 family)
VRRIACVLFDLDGVLVDATEWHYEALNRALRLFGCEVTRYEHLSTYNGLPTRKKLEILTVEKGLPSALHGIVNRLKQVYTREEVLTRCRPVFDKEYMLARLRREGYRLAVCSNAVRDSVEMMIHQSGLDEYFEFLLSNEDVRAPKPDPEVYLTAMARMGVPPEQTMVVEDAPLGIEAARRSGAHVCQVNGFSEVHYFRLRSALDRIQRPRSGNGLEVRA